MRTRGRTQNSATISSGSKIEPAKEGGYLECSLCTFLRACIIFRSLLTDLEIEKIEENVRSNLLKKVKARMCKRFGLLGSLHLSQFFLSRKH